jgi:hypothetical protein
MEWVVEHRQGAAVEDGGTPGYHKHRGCTGNYRSQRTGDASPATTVAPTSSLPAVHHDQPHPDRLHGSTKGFPF